MENRSYDSLSVGDIVDGIVTRKQVFNFNGINYNRVNININNSDGSFNSFIFNLHELYYENLNKNSQVKVKIIKKFIDKKKGAKILNLAFIPNKKLLGLDLNGILLKRQYINDNGIRLKDSKPFNFVQQFLEYCCQNFDVIIWTCCERKNVEYEFLESTNMNFISILSQNDSTKINGRNSVVSNEKPLFLKEISKLNNILERNQGLNYGSNILLIDNHEEKYENNEIGSGLIFNDEDVNEDFLSENGIFKQMLNYYCDNDNDVINISNQLLNDDNYKKHVWDNRNLSTTSYSNNNNSSSTLTSSFSNINHQLNNVKEKFIRNIVDKNEDVQFNLHLNICPGIRAQNLSRANYTKILKDRYLVCEKTDGVRFMLYMEHDESYLIDRALNFFKIEVSDSFYTECTILDGELVIQKQGEVNTLVYLIFDVVKFDGEETDLLDQGLNHRLSYLNNYFPSDISLNFVNTKPREFENYNYIQVKRKEFYKLTEIQTICDRFEINDKDIKYTKDGITSNCDGLVFTPELKKYSEIGNVFKWKPKCLNTIDFKINKSNILDEQDEIHLLISGRTDSIFYNIKKQETHMYQEIKYYFENENCNSLIVECSINSNEWDIKWDIKSIRTDKSRSNSSNTVLEIMNLLLLPLELEDIKSYITNL
jgi:hypothetical protein